MADKNMLKEFKKMVEESIQKNPLIPKEKLTEELSTKIKQEKGLPGTDSSFKTPVVTSDEYHNLMRELRKGYGKKKRPWEKKPGEHPFKGPIKKLEDERRGEEWDKLLESLDKIKDYKKREAIVEKWNFDKWYRDTMEKHGSRFRQI